MSKRIIVTIQDGIDEQTAMRVALDLLVLMEREPQFSGITRGDGYNAFNHTRKGAKSKSIWVQTDTGTVGGES